MGRVPGKLTTLGDFSDFLSGFGDFLCDFSDFLSGFSEFLCGFSEFLCGFSEFLGGFSAPLCGFRVRLGDFAVRPDGFGDLFGCFNEFLSGKDAARSPLHRCRDRRRGFDALAGESLPSGAHHVAPFDRVGDQGFGHR